MNSCRLLASMGLLVAAVVLSSVVQSSAGPVKLDPRNIDYLLTSISQLKDLAAGNITLTFDSLNERDKTALDKLIRLIDQGRAGELCSQSHADAIRDYFTDFINRSHRNPQKVNKLIKKFYIAYGLRVSYLCRERMVNLITNDVHDYLAEVDYLGFEMWAAENSITAKIITTPDDSDELIVPRNLARLLVERQNPNGTDNKIYLEAGSGSVLADLKYVCKHRYRPIYEQIILPLVTLSSVGFNYKGSNIRGQNELTERVTCWYRIVLLCESLEDVEIVQHPGTSSSNHVRILTADEIKAYKVALDEYNRRVADLTAQLNSFTNTIPPPTSDDSTETTTGSSTSSSDSGSSDGDGDTDSESDEEEDISEDITYHPSPKYDAVLEDQIVSPDRQFMKAVDKFNDCQSKIDLIKSETLRKMLNFVKNGLKKGAVKVAGVLSGAGANGLKGEKDYTNFQMVKFLDEFLGQVESGDEAAERPASAMGLGERLNILFRLNLVQAIFVAMLTNPLVLVSSPMIARG